MSASLAGSIFGAVVLGMLADRFGRKWMLFLCAVLVRSLYPAHRIYYQRGTVGYIPFLRGNRDRRGCPERCGLRLRIRAEPPAQDLCGYHVRRGSCGSDACRAHSRIFYPPLRLAVASFSWAASYPSSSPWLRWCFSLNPWSSSQVKAAINRGFGRLSPGWPRLSAGTRITGSLSPR